MQLETNRAVKHGRGELILYGWRLPAKESGEGTRSLYPPTLCRRGGRKEAHEEETTDKRSE